MRGGVVRLAPGVLLSLGIGVVATLISIVIPVAGSALPAVIIGVLVAIIRKPSERLQPGIKFSSKQLLQFAIVLLGAQLSLTSLYETGLITLPVLAASLATALIGAAVIGRLLRVPSRERTLIGVGTGICGASAIAAISPVIRARSSEVSYAIATIFLFNLIAIAAFPALGHWLGMSPHTFGVLAGSAINDTSSVVAAASLFAPAALGFAVAVKLVRTLAIIPISIVLAIRESRRSEDTERLTGKRVFKLVPWFLWGFIAVVALNTVLPVPANVQEGLTAASVFLIATALGAIGMTTDVRSIGRAGWRPLALGGILWVLITLVSILVINVTIGIA